MHEHTLLFSSFSLKSSNKTTYKKIEYAYSHFKNKHLHMLCHMYDFNIRQDSGLTLLLSKARSIFSEGGNNMHSNCKQFQYH